MARKADADIMIDGHTHIPYRKNLIPPRPPLLKGGEGGLVFINAGSVGKPKDGDTRTCVCIVDITPDNVNTEFLRIPYDVEKVASAIIESGLPSYFAEKLRWGK
jgi:diadenosine tetraphosphatase ApaH/serine/threonine PP2A family protein phosphatase